MIQISKVSKIVESVFIYYTNNRFIDIFIFSFKNGRTEILVQLFLNNKPGLIYLFQTVHHCGENNFSSTERANLGDGFCRPFFVLCLLAILFAVLLRLMDSDYLFGIFKLVLHIKSKELLALILSVPSEGYCRNAYMMWGFWCDCSLC